MSQYRAEFYHGCSKLICQGEIDFNGAVDEINGQGNSTFQIPTTQGSGDCECVNEMWECIYEASNGKVGFEYVKIYRDNCLVFDGWAEEYCISSDFISVSTMSPSEFMKTQIANDDYLIGGTYGEAISQFFERQGYFSTCNSEIITDEVGERLGNKLFRCEKLDGETYKGTIGNADLVNWYTSDIPCPLISGTYFKLRENVSGVGVAGDIVQYTGLNSGVFSQYWDKSYLPCNLPIGTTFAVTHPDNPLLTSADWGNGDCSSRNVGHVFTINTDAQNQTQYDTQFEFGVPPCPLVNGDRVLLTTDIDSIGEAGTIIMVDTSPDTQYPLDSSDCPITSDDFIENISYRVIGTYDASQPDCNISVGDFTCVSGCSNSSTAGFVNLGNDNPLPCPVNEGDSYVVGNSGTYGDTYLFNGQVITANKGVSVGDCPSSISDFNISNTFCGLEEIPENLYEVNIKSLGCIVYSLDGTIPTPDGSSGITLQTNQEITIDGGLANSFKYVPCEDNEYTTVFIEVQYVTGYRVSLKSDAGGLLQEIESLGYEWSFKDCEVCFNKIGEGQENTEPLIWDYESPSTSNVEYNPVKCYNAQSYTDYVVTDGCSVNSADRYSGDKHKVGAYITTTSQNCVQELETHLDNNNKPTTEYDIVATDCGTCYRAGDYVRFTVRTCLRETSLNEKIRIARVTTQYINGQYETRLTLSNDPLITSFEDRIDRRITNLENGEV